MGARPLRILQVLRAPIGGLYRHVADLSKELAERGHALGLVMDSRLEDAHTDKRLAPLKDHLPLGIHRMPIARLLGLSDITTPLALRRLCAELDVDIIHGHGAKGGFHARLARFGKSAPKAIYTPHGGALHFDAKSLQGRLFDGIEYSLFSQSDGIIFESAYAQGIYLKRIGTPPCPHPVIHNGLARSEFDAVTPHEHAVDFGFVGELRDLKGVTYLLDALASVMRPDGQPARLIMAGDGALRPALEARASQADLAGHVEFLGVQPAREVFAQCRCVVLPSLAESLPYAVLEAAAAGKPVITTNVGGIPEIFAPDAQSLLPPGDVGALEIAMKAFLADEAAAFAQARGRMDRLEREFSVSSMTERVEKLYQQVIST